MGYNNLWRLDLSSMKAFLVANSSDEGGAIDSRFMFTSDGAVCGGKYYAPYWYTNDGDVMHRAYGIASFDLTSHEFQGGLTEDLNRTYYGLWCDPSSDSGAGLLVVSAHNGWNGNADDDDFDPLRVESFLVERIDTSSWSATTAAGPISAPPSEYVPIADGSFSFDGNDKIWASFSWDHQPGLKHLNGGVTTVLDLSSNSTAQHFTKSGAGYVEKTQATPSGKTWAVMRQLKHKDTKNVLTLARLTLSPGEQTLATDTGNRHPP